jgi:hypothetical protein
LDVHSPAQEQIGHVVNVLLIEPFGNWKRLVKEEGTARRLGQIVVIPASIQAIKAIRDNRQSARREQEIMPKVDTRLLARSSQSLPLLHPELFIC